MGDLIDRQSILQEIHERICTGCTFIHPDGCAVCNVWSALCEIKDAPIVEQKRGEWEFFVEKSFNGEVVEVDDYGWRCSHCKTPLADVVGGYWDDESEKPTVNFCPNCGAYMRRTKKE